MIVVYCSDDSNSHYDLLTYIRPYKRTLRISTVSRPVVLLGLSILRLDVIAVVYDGLYSSTVSTCNVYKQHLRYI